MPVIPIIKRRKDALAGTRLDPTKSSGIVGLYDFNYGDNKRVFDQSAYINHGDWEGGSTERYEIGPRGRAGLFVADNDDHVACGSGDFIEGLTEITFAAWIYSTDASVSSPSGIITKGNVNTGIQYRPNVSRPFFYIDANLLAPAGVLAPNEWHHYVGRFKSGETDGMFICVDGIVVGSKTVTATIPSDADSLWIGGASDVITRFFSGLISDARIYNLGLAVAEIRDIYNDSKLYYLEKHNSVSFIPDGVPPSANDADISQKLPGLNQSVGAVTESTAAISQALPGFTQAIGVTIETNVSISQQMPGLTQTILADHGIQISFADITQQLPGLSQAIGATLETNVGILQSLPRLQQEIHAVRFSDLDAVISQSLPRLQQTIVTQTADTVSADISQLLPGLAQTLSVTTQASASILQQLPGLSQSIVATLSADVSISQSLPRLQQTIYASAVTEIDADISQVLPRLTQGVQVSIEVNAVIAQVLPRLAQTIYAQTRDEVRADISQQLPGLAQTILVDDGIWRANISQLLPGLSQELVVDYFTGADFACFDIITTCSTEADITSTVTKEATMVTSSSCATVDGYCACSQYDVGDTARISMSVTNADGDFFDPVNVEVSWITPAGVTVEKKFGVDEEVVKVDVGRYYVAIPLTESGTWRWRWWCSDPISAADEGSLWVADSAFS